MPMLNVYDLAWGALWLVFAALFTSFIVFFGRRKYATMRLGFVFILLFFMAGLGMLLANLHRLH